jgi:hypothetical protein
MPCPNCNSSYCPIWVITLPLDAAGRAFIWTVELLMTSTCVCSKCTAIRGQNVQACRRFPRWVLLKLWDMIPP